jgi:hypothetical protein
MDERIEHFLWTKGFCISFHERKDLCQKNSGNLTEISSPLKKAKKKEIQEKGC